MNHTRRSFLRVAAPLILSPGVLGRAGATAPNSKIRLACIGLGGQGTSNMRAFLTDERVQVVAVCDVDAKHREAAAAMAKLGKGDTYNDFREVLARKDVDAVMNATPDFWHSNVAIAAAQAGKDLYSEKPLAASIAEGRAICVETISALADIPGVAGVHIMAPNNDAAVPDVIRAARASVKRLG